MPTLRRLLAAVVLLSATRLPAQGTTDVIRGRVVDDSSKVVVAATVFVTRGPDRAVKQTTTDSAGRYSVTFEDGTGDYLVAVSSVGLKSARRRVQRQDQERVLVADFVLSSDVAALAAVKVTAEKPAKANNAVNPYSAETGAAEKWSDGVDGQLSPSLAGNISALLGTVPGLTMGPNGASMLGAANESNLTTLNGMAMSAASLPRAARTDTRVTGATFDPTRGGFAGANIDVRLAPGSRNYQQRNAYFTLESPQLQYTDAVGRSLGARTASYRGSLGADGEIIRKALTYNVAVDVTSTSSDPATLLSADTPTFARAGVSRDSVARLIATAQGLRIPLGGLGIPDNRQHDAVSWLGRFDDTRDSLVILTLTTYVTSTRDGALSFQPLSAPSAGGRQDQGTFGAQLQYGKYFGEGLRALNQTRFGFNQVHTSGSPYLSLPGASVLVGNGATDVNGVTALNLGGSSYLGNSNTRWTAEGANETIWNAHGRKHTFKTLLWMRADGLQSEGGTDLLGHYGYNSIDDLAANHPSSYSRTLTQPERAGQVWNAAAAMAHQWAPTRFFSILYGARVEANGFFSAPPANPALESALGVGTGNAPTLFHVSPRFGFSYTYNRDKDNGNGSSQNPIGRFYRNTSGVIKGGIGEFRDLLRPDILADARSRTGLAGSTQSLSCVGTAVPTPDWSRFLGDQGSVPAQCADGSGALAQLAPPATLIDKSYDVPRSWRASLDWNGDVGPFLLRVSTLASYGMNQPGTVDANFAGTSKFALAGEGNRPVFVSPSSIDPSSGAVSAAEARRSAAFGTVGVRRG
ncbi:MAG: carboxypeptidase regulatory-like domain-containing protein, partial [Gemmatimonadales bacterium]